MVWRSSACTQTWEYLLTRHKLFTLEIDGNTPCVSRSRMQISEVSNFRGNTSKLNFTCIHELCILFIEEFEDTKGVIWICISKTNLQHNSQRKREQMDKQRSANIRRNVLKFYKFDEKRTITPRWVIRFTSKLQGR
jgi:hypothetical protein